LREGVLCSAFCAAFCPCKVRTSIVLPIRADCIVLERQVHGSMNQQLLLLTCITLAKRVVARSLHLHSVSTVKSKLHLGIIPRQAARAHLTCLHVSLQLTSCCILLPAPAWTPENPEKGWSRVRGAVSLLLFSTHSDTVLADAQVICSRGPSLLRPVYNWCVLTVY
jgi:hypothetical protein